MTGIVLDACRTRNEVSSAFKPLRSLISDCSSKCLLSDAYGNVVMRMVMKTNLMRSKKALSPIPEQSRATYLSPLGRKQRNERMTRMTGLAV